MLLKRNLQKVWCKSENPPCQTGFFTSGTLLHCDARDSIAQSREVEADDFDAVRDRVLPNASIFGLRVTRRGVELPLNRNCWERSLVLVPPMLAWALLRVSVALTR